MLLALQLSVWRFSLAMVYGSVRRSFDKIHPPYSFASVAISAWPGGGRQVYLPLICSRIAIHSHSFELPVYGGGNG